MLLLIKQSDPLRSTEYWT